MLTCASRFVAVLLLALSPLVAAQPAVPPSPGAAGSSPAATAPPPSSAAAPPAAGATSMPRERLYLVVFSLGPAWVAGKPPPEQPAFREHGQNLKRLRDADRIAMGARYADKGMIVLRSTSEAAAREEIAADPGVRAGTFTFELNELVPFYPGYVGPPKN